MGTSRSGSVGSSTRWKVTREHLKTLADAALDSLPSPKPTKDRPHRKPRGAGGGAKGGAGGEARSIPQRPAAPLQAGTPRTIRDLGKRLAGAAAGDNRFDPQVGDCAVKVAIEQLIGLFNSSTIRFKIEPDKLFAAYGIPPGKSLGPGLAIALDKRFRDDVITKCRQANDTAENARQAIEGTLVEMLTSDGNKSTFLKLNAETIHSNLRKSNTMKIVERFYANYLFAHMESLVSSLHADISFTAQRNFMSALRETYCDAIPKLIVKRAREKGWRPSDIPDKADEWRDLLVEEEVHA